MNDIQPATEVNDSNEHVDIGLQWKKSWAADMSESHQTIRALAQKVLSSLRGLKEIPSETLLSLAFVFGDNLVMSALDIVDRGLVLLYKSPSAAPLVNVKGSKGQQYLVLPETSYCDCEVYKFKVAKGLEMMCKHVLAAKVATALSLCKEVQITDKAFQQLVVGATSH
eukprot:m.1228486 g.1228486  ORF g.1228486 m.1228486 type:complete len:168 (-) comp24644_c1_seq3:1123-1626(-)